MQRDVAVPGDLHMCFRVFSVSLNDQLVAGCMVAIASRDGGSGVN
jgi:hypothetical protein